MRIQSYINSAENILSLYDGMTPFSIWLKGFFAQHKKYGSKDRKHIAHLCYCTLRLGHALRQYQVADRIKMALFLCSTEPNSLLNEVNAMWNEKAQETIFEKFKILGCNESELAAVFPWQEEVSDEINKEEFVLSFLKQPLLFLRIRPGKKESVISTLKQHEVSFEVVSHDCLALPNSAKVDSILAIDKEVVVQDVNSQKVFDPLVSVLPNHKIKVWDCCAASGGKSILLFDTFNNVQLTVSDVRQSILQNLKNRFLRAGIHHYKSFIADAATVKLPDHQHFDLVICDAPCSGSGTWSRTPEQLYFFTKDKIDYYSSLQKNIVKNATKYLANRGYFLYITCSVFKKENEEVVRLLEQETNLQLLSKNYFKGYDKKADTLFVALFCAQ